MSKNVRSNFVFDLKKTFVKVFEMMKKGFADDCSSRTITHMWWRRFENGGESFEDESSETHESKTAKIQNQDNAYCIFRFREDNPTRIRATGTNSECDILVINIIDIKLWNACCTVSGESGPSTRIRVVGHFCITTRQRIRWISWSTVVDHSPYSPDQAPVDFFLFPKLKLKMKGTFFNDIPAVQAACTKELKAIPVAKYSKAFELLYR